MPVIARFYGIVIRMLSLRSFGVRLHAFHGDGEMVVDLKTLRVIDGNLPEAIREMVLAWVGQHQQELLGGYWRAG
jgi:hypothetical protein